MIMEEFRNLSAGTKTLIAASGVVLTSIGAYVLYTKLKEKQSATRENGKAGVICKRQPSENVDDSEVSVQGSGKKVLVLGLEKSGKSCLLAAMTHDETEKQYQPTLGFNVVCITNIGERLNIMEIGGSKAYREHWDKFLKDTSILLYVIDSCEKDAVPSALDGLKDLLTSEELQNVPVVIVFSKRDDNTAIPTQEMIDFVEKRQFGEQTFKYANVQVKCGGAPVTNGVFQLQETLVQLARNPQQ